HSCQPWQAFGRPRLCFAVSAGNMDSMLNHYTAARKVRNEDAYSPGGQIGRRPDRATLAYCQRAREAYHGVPVITGGVEASLRRIAHYDYWSDKVRRSIVLDAKADLLVYGMGERPLVEIVRRLAAGETVEDLRDIRGTVYRLGARSTLPPWPEGVETVELPSYEQVRDDRVAFAQMTRLAHAQSDPYGARRLVQPHGPEAVVINPPSLPLEESELDRLFSLPFTRRPHPSYAKARIPAFDVVKDSVQIMRGCFGGCSFCSLSAHQGRIVQSRSEDSVLAELHRIAESKDFKGTISDLGGPTANMYRMNCTQPAARAKCRRSSCLHPTICRLLHTDHEPLRRRMAAARLVPGIRNVLIASGVRMDLAQRSTAYIHDLAAHHTGGLLKVAPEHAQPDVLHLMHKPPIEVFEAFRGKFEQAAADAGRQLYLVPYFMAGHPGCDLHAMIELALFLKRHHLRPEQVQDFIPAPMDLATCMYHTGIDPITGQEVPVARGARPRRLQRALMQYFMPENYDDVRLALEEAGRGDLIGDRSDCLIPAHRPQFRPASHPASRA
ncbi:MAG: YgiQ family radical SAM protein, partial [Patescibacteria group bacterium]|nr:YgiQ family radical SAM protein [Patescibacteria group bacterium]